VGRTPIRNFLKKNAAEWTLKAARPIEPVCVSHSWSHFRFLHISLLLFLYQERLLTAKTIEDWFETLKEWWRKNSDTPSALIANFDETMGVVSAGKIKVLVPRGVRQPIVAATATPDEHITIGVFIFANGTRMKKLNLVLPRKNMPDLQIDLSDPDALRGSIADKYTWHGQESGWITAAILRQIISEVCMYPHCNIPSQHNTLF